MRGIPGTSIQADLYSDYVHEVLVQTRARSLCLGIIGGNRGDSICHMGDIAYAPHLPIVFETLARDFLAGAFDYRSPYDSILDEIHRTVHAEASWLIVVEGRHGSHIYRVGPPDFLSSDFMPDFLITSARLLRSYFAQVLH